MISTFKLPLTELDLKNPKLAKPLCPIIRVNRLGLAARIYIRMAVIVTSKQNKMDYQSHYRALD